MSTVHQNAKILAKKFRLSYFNQMFNHLLNFEQTLLSNGIEVYWIENKSQLIDIVSDMMPKAFYNKICYDSKTIPDAIKNENKFFQHISPDSFANGFDVPEFLFLDADYGIVENGALVLIDNPLQKRINKVQNLILFLSIDKLLLKSSNLEDIIHLINENNEKTIFPKNIHLITSSFNKVDNKEFALNAEAMFDLKKIKVSVFFCDFGVTNLLKDSVLTDALLCIDCGKCKQVCPVYKNQPTYSPIELIKYNAQITNIKNRNTFNYTCLCGNCDEICPVLIPFTSIFQYQMQLINTKLYKENTLSEAKIYTKRGNLNKLNNKFRRYLYCKRYFRENKKLYNYFKTQNNTFYNVFQRKED